MNPRHSYLVIPFVNLRADGTIGWLAQGSVSMLDLALSQWRELKVVSHERVHDLLQSQNLTEGGVVGLDQARKLAREDHVWTVVVGEFERTRDSLHLVARAYDVATGARLDGAEVRGTPGRRRAPALRRARRQAARPLRRADGGPDRPRQRHQLVARGVPALPRRSRAAQSVEPGRRGAGLPGSGDARQHVQPGVFPPGPDPRAGSPTRAIRSPGATWPTRPATRAGCRRASRR